MTIQTRSFYDQTRLNRVEKQNQNYNSHLLLVDSFENKNACVNPNISAQGENNVARPLNAESLTNLEQKADIENKVQNRHLELSANRTNTDYAQVPVNTPQMCDPFTSSVFENTRHSQSISLNRGMSPMEKSLIFHKLHMNPQNVMIQNEQWNNPIDRLGESSRNSSRVYANTVSEYKRITGARANSNDLNNFQNDVSGLLPGRRN